MLDGSDPGFALCPVRPLRGRQSRGLGDISAIPIWEEFLSEGLAMSSILQAMRLDDIARDAHLRFVKNLDSGPESFEHYATEHLRMSGIYWALMTLEILDQIDLLPAQPIVDFVIACGRDDGGFGGNLHHDSHLLYTLSAIQILVALERLHTIDIDRTAQYIASLQESDGGFRGDEWGEVDTRFSYCAMNALMLLGQRHRIDWDAAVAFILRCRNFDGGFGSVPGAESHAGQIFCCVAALKIADRLDDGMDMDQLAWWLAERQLPSGGLNGRPEKKEDVCYSWWVLSSLAILDRLDWIDTKALARFIRECQDVDAGGISDRPGNQTDIFHTFFGLAALTLIESGIDQDRIDPVYALPASILSRCPISKDSNK